MAKLCSKSQKNSFVKNQSNNDFASRKCKLKLNYPPVSEDLGIKALMQKADEGNLRLNMAWNQNLMGKGKLKYQCHYEDRKRRVELRRKKILQKLKKVYKIDAEGLTENATREIIMKAEQIEKEKKERERRNIERTVIMITRLIEEQKYKTQGKKASFSPWRKPAKSISTTVCPGTDIEEEGETTHVSEMGEENEISCSEKASVRSTEISLRKSVSLKSALKRQRSLQEPIQERKEEEEKDEEEEEEIEGEEEATQLPICGKHNKKESSFREGLTHKPRVCFSLEKDLESTPKCVVFQDYKKNKVYLQDLKITNIGLETIHCRYLGIVVHIKSEKRFPIGVAVRDNVKLRPGLCCSTKIRLCSQDDTKELQCSVVYETRRKNKPLQHSWFFVQVMCIPVRAIVRVTPLKITFPLLTWCESTGPEGDKLNKKFLKIENSGGKACSCRISSSSIAPQKDTEGIEIEGELSEVDVGTISSNTKSDSVNEINYSKQNLRKSEEIYGEYMEFSEDFSEISALLVHELIENIFTTFRFSQKYYIEIPPFSTTQIEVKFIPQYKGFHQEMHFLQFENCENCTEQAIELVGDIKKIPLKAEPQVIDLKTCVSNSGVYSGTFQIFNETKGPYSVFVKIPSSVKKHAHVHPKATTILPLNCSDFSVRLYPRVSLARDAPQYYQEDSQILEFPLFIHPANVGVCKRDHIKIYVFALITNYCLQLTPSSVDFGCVTTLETVRAELKLTNHSLAIQEYGFINLPKEIRIEPNMGFGRILPKESISLYLLYSPVEDTIEYDETQGNHEFQISVTSIAKYGGFKEKLEEDDKSESIEWLWGEDYACELSALNEKSLSDEQNVESGTQDEFDICEDDSSLEDEELDFKIYQEQSKIRKFLREDLDKISQDSIFKRKSLAVNSKTREIEEIKENLSEIGELEELENSLGIWTFSQDLHIVNCRACIVQPRCRISESVIQLPATPCSSFSLYRFRLTAIENLGSCSCGFRRISKKCKGKPSFNGSFEFQYFCPHIKLEPESGFIKPGDSQPITVIYRPEFPAEQLRHNSKEKKFRDSTSEKRSENETTIPRTRASTKDSKKKPSISKKDFSYENAIEDIINVSLFELENYDSFAGERSLQELISPFYVETKIHCVIKTIQCEDEKEMTEIHEMILICPAIKPNFIYLGNSQEIKFNKVFIGTKSKFILQIQNISFERISPSATFLNPVGPFYCPAGLHQIEIDPEHIWRQPLVYSPLKEKKIEKEFFEIFCGSTSILLTVTGEGVQPEYKIHPNFSCCLLESKPGVVEELKLEIENISSVVLNLSLKTNFVKELLNLEKNQLVEGEMRNKSEKVFDREETREKKKSRTSSIKRNIQFWEEIPEVVLSALESSVDIQDENLLSKVFTLVGVNDGNEISVPPSGRQLIKVQFFPLGEISDKILAIKYGLMLEKASLLKEVIVLGIISK